MRVLAWCLEATGTALMVLAYVMLFAASDDQFNNRVLSSLTFVCCVGGYFMKDTGMRLRKGGAALKAMRS